MSTHPAKQQLEKLMPSLREFQSLAASYGVVDIFQDNGGKLFQMIVQLNLTIVAGREGNDAKDSQGNEYELKSLNAELTSSFSTHHHMNPSIIHKYRKVAWIFAVYKGIELQTIYILSPVQMEPYFSYWEDRWNNNGNKDLNNPKVPLKYVVAQGIVLFDCTKSSELFLLPSDAVAKLSTKEKPPPLQQTKKSTKGSSEEK